MGKKKIQDKFPGGGLKHGFTPIPNGFLDYAGELEMSAQQLQFYMTVKRFYHLQLITDEDIQEKTGWGMDKIYRLRKEWEKAGCIIQKKYTKSKDGKIICIGTVYDFSEIEANIEAMQDRKKNDTQNVVYLKTI